MADHEIGIDWKSFIVAPLTDTQVVTLSSKTASQMGASTISGSSITIDGATYAGHELVDDLGSLNVKSQYDTIEQSPLNSANKRFKLTRQEFEMDAMLYVNDADDASYDTLVINQKGHKLVRAERKTGKVDTAIMGLSADVNTSNDGSMEIAATFKLTQGAVGRRNAAS